MSSNAKQPRVRNLAKAQELAQRHIAGIEDPWAGVISERALLYTPDSGRRAGKWGFDGTPGSAQRVFVHGDGHSTAHVGNCATEPTEPLHERLIRHAGLDRDEAEYVRLVFARPGIRDFELARELRVSLRTVQRRDASVRAKLAQWKVDLRKAAWDEAEEPGQ